MIAILISYQKKQLYDLDSQFQSLFTQYTALVGLDEFVEKQIEKEFGVVPYNKEIISRKENTFMRDKTAFSEHKTQKWKKETQGQFRNFQPEDVFESDVSSISPSQGMREIHFK